MRKFLAVLFAAVAPFQAHAQAGLVPPDTAVESVKPCCTVPALTLVELVIGTTINSQANKIGEKFPFLLTRPIIVDDKILVPAGTPGSGDIVHAAKSGMGGKPGELILAARYLDYNGLHIPLRSLKLGSGRGKDNGDAALGVAATISPVVGLLMTGGEVNVPAGTKAEAKVSTDTVVRATADIPAAAEPNTARSAVPSPDLPPKPVLPKGEKQ